MAKTFTTDAVVHQHGPSERRANIEIEHKFVEVSHEHRVEALVRELRHDGDLTLVFVRTKHGADRLVKRLATHGVCAVAMHGNKSQRQREQALARFESGAVHTLVATDVAARGIDVNGISHVINFDPPADSETYVHRIGRTGRAGRTGTGITLLTPDEQRDVAADGPPARTRPRPAQCAPAARDRAAASTPPRRQCPPAAPPPHSAGVPPRGRRAQHRFGVGPRG